jgi:hypothetical protein
MLSGVMNSSPLEPASIPFDIFLGPDVLPFRFGRRTITGMVANCLFERSHEVLFLCVSKSD